MIKSLLRSAACGLAFALAVAGTLAIAQTISRSVQLSQDPSGPFGVDTNNNLYLQGNRHLNAGPGGPATALGTCAGGTLVAGSTDFSGQVTGSSGTSCIVNFGQTWGTAPRCVTSGSVSSAATTGPVSNTTSTTAITMTVAATGAGTFTYICNGVN